MCVFCKIVNKEISTEILDTNEVGIIIRAKDPAATRHYLAIGRHCDPDIHATCQRDFVHAGRMLSLATHFANINLPEGYRIVTNVGSDSGQTMKHLHFHILGGEKLKDI